MFVYNKRNKNQTNFDKRGRLKIIDSISENAILEKYRHIINHHNNEEAVHKPIILKKKLKEMIKLEAIATNERLFPGKILKKAPSLRTLNRYCDYILAKINT
jgi:glucuronate isomerase